MAINWGYYEDRASKIDKKIKKQSGLPNGGSTTNNKKKDIPKKGSKKKEKASAGHKTRANMTTKAQIRQSEELSKPIKALGKTGSKIMSDAFDSNEDYTQKFKKGDIGGGVANFIGSGITAAQSLYLNGLNNADSIISGNGTQPFKYNMSNDDYQRAVVARRGGGDTINDMATKTNPILGAVVTTLGEIGTDPLELTPLGTYNDIKTVKQGVKSVGYAKDLQKGKLAKTADLSIKNEKGKTAPEPIVKPANEEVSPTKALKRKGLRTSYLDGAKVSNQYKQVFNDYVNSIDNTLKQFVDNSRSKTVGNKAYKDFAIVDSATVNEIKELTGVDTTDYSYRLKANTINEHIDPHHGMTGSADKSMADSNDVARMKYVVENYDNIELVRNADGTPNFSKEFNNSDNTKAKKVRFTKRVDGHYYVVTAVPDTKAKALNVVSVYIKKADALDTPTLSSTTGRMADAQHLTPETLDAIPASNFKIADNVANVNGLNRDLGADVNKYPTGKETSTSMTNFLLDEKELYETETHAQRNYSADLRIPTDKAGEISELLNKANWDTEDIAVASKLIPQIDNLDEKMQMIKKSVEQSSKKGQELEAVKHFKENTIDAKLYEAEQAAKRAQKDIASENPKLTDKIDADAKKIDEVVKGDTANLEDAINDIIKGKKKRKTVLEKVMKQIEDGSYNSDTAADALREVNGVPVLTREDASNITEYMRNYENATASYEKRMWKAKAEQVIADKTPSTFEEKFRALQRISMLSNPKTLLSRNAGGNILLMTAENIKDIPASLIDMAVSLKTGARTTRGLTPTKLKSQAKGFAEGTSDWAKDIKYGVDTSVSRGHYELPNKRIFKNKALNFMDQFTRQGLQLGDRPFYTSAYNSRVAELENLVNKGKLNLSGDDIALEAKRFALDRVFQADTNLSKGASKLRESLNDMSSGLPLGDLIIPFTQTPANILDKLIDYSPLGTMRAVKQLGKIGKGTFDQKRFVDVLGRSLTGAGVLMLGYKLASDGILTGDTYDPTKKEYSNARSLAGEQSYSLDLGDKYYSIDWASPIGNLLILGAEAQKAGVNTDDFLGSMGGAMTTMVDSVFSQSFLSGVTSMMSGYSPAEGIVNSLLGSTSQVTPTPIANIAKIIDPVKRETYDPNKAVKAWNVIKSRTPFLSETLPEKVDIAGNTVYQNQGRETGSRVLENFLLPSNISEKVNNPVNDELLRLYKSTGEASILLNKSNKDFDYGGKNFVLDGEELSRFQRQQGITATANMKKLMQTNAYNQMNQSEKVKALAAINLEAEKAAQKDYLLRHGYTKDEMYLGDLSGGKRTAIASTGLSQAKQVDVAKNANKDGDIYYQKEDLIAYLNTKDWKRSTKAKVFRALANWNAHNPYE